MLCTADNVFAAQVGLFAHCSNRPRVFRRASCLTSSTSARRVLHFLRETNYTTAVLGSVSMISSARGM